jgi:AcrR family transcriptional regulator
MNSSQKSKSKIIKSARENFANRGFYGTSMSSIAENAAVNKSALYYHFRSKENLYRLVFQSSLIYVVNHIHSDLIHARLHVKNTSMDEVLNDFWETHPQIMKLFIHELNNGAENLREILIKIPDYKKNIVQKLVFILNTLKHNKNTKDTSIDETIIRSATSVMTYSMSRRLADNFVSAIFNTQN